MRTVTVSLTALTLFAGACASAPVAPVSAPPEPVIVSRPIVLYLNMYDPGEPLIPKGLTARE